MIESAERLTYCLLYTLPPSKMMYKNVFKHIKRHYSYRNIKNNITSDEIRENFLKYFINEKSHKFIRSSPVVPFCDPTVAFVNAGMNQFKSIFLGKIQPKFPRVANSQKCIRVGGKHNDLLIVGQDGYHHTFFEMLGNWSFGDYFKKDACKMAWELLKGPFGIDSSRLYVTYFAGDESLQLPPDIECREIWRSLGIPDDRILPFGSKDNFWEMGSTGPCGPCTEIHIDHLPNSSPVQRAKYVNAGRKDLTELWNLVFIQYNRNNDGTITMLPEKHIDTGMGFERLVAILQNKSTNYETDLFIPIFEIIQKAANVPAYGNKYGTSKGDSLLDTSYRILADHGRMVTACLSDGMLPDQNHKLRRILRKSLLLSDNIFKRKNLLNDVVQKVVEILGPTYPEMKTNMKNTLQIISHESEVFEALRKNSEKEFTELLSINPNLEALDLFDSPGFTPAYKELQTIKDTFKDSIVPGTFLFKLRDTYGLDDDAIEQIAELEKLRIDKVGLEKELINAKQRTKQLFQLHSDSSTGVDQYIYNYTTKIPGTEDSYKYRYKFNKDKQKYQVEPLKAKIVAILDGSAGDETVEACSKKVYNIITDKTNFYCESGGQQYDKGAILLSVNEKDVRFEVDAVSKINGCVVHSGKFTNLNYKLNINIMDNVQLIINEHRRTLNTLHHTATHLLNASVRDICKSVVYQISSSVTSDNLKLELGILGRKINKEDLVLIEDLVRKVILSDTSVTINEICAEDVFNMDDITVVPGEIYPENGLRLLTVQNDNIKFISKELCCGSHAFKTSELKEFCITNFKQNGRAKYQLTAIAGESACNAVEIGKSFESSISKLEASIVNESEKLDTIESRLQKIKSEIIHNDTIMPFVTKTNCLDKINDLCKKIRDSSRTSLKQFLEIEMKNLLEQNPLEKMPFIVHFLNSSTLLETVPLQKATRLCTDRPIIVLSLSDGMIKARCCVPKDKISENFTAQQWLEEIAIIFKAQVSPPKGQDPKEVCNMKAKKVVSAIFEDQLENALRKASEFAIKRL